MKSLFLILTNLCFTLAAATVDTNQSAALINPNTQSNWEQTQQALISVLSKKSGFADSKIKKQYAIDENFKAAIVRSYHERVAGGASYGNQWFNLIVDEEEMHRLMLNQKIPIWPDRRGGVYVWVVEEQLDEPLAHANITSESIYWLQKWFNVMGVPTQFYDAGAEDLLAFKPQDVRYLNPDLIDFIQAENEVSKTLLVFIKHSSNGYSYRFGLAEPDQEIVIKNLQFVDLAGGMKALASSVQNIMAEGQRLFADEFENNTVSITVNDLTDANSVLKLMDYFDQHALVENYQVNQLKSKQVSVMMRIKVLPETFIKFVENEGLLTHQPVGLGRSLLFKWLP